MTVTPEIPTGTNLYPKVISVLSHEGSDVGTGNPLPVILYDNSGGVIKIRQVEENRLGSECNGADGATGRVLTLANTRESGGPVSVWVETQLVSTNDFSVVHKSASSTVTFDSLEVANADEIKVLYYD